MAALGSNLSTAAVTWLSVLAIYPELYWALTLHIGARLAVEAGSGTVNTEALGQLVALPWLRYGHIPDWLRVRLIRALTPGDAERVGAIIDELFITALEPLPKNLLLEIGTHGLKSLDSVDVRLDHIMLEYMERRKSRVTDYELPAGVANKIKHIGRRVGITDFWGRDELRHMHSAAMDWRTFAEANIATRIILPIWSTATMAPEHGEIGEYRTEFGIVALPATTYAVRLDGMGDNISIVDEVSFLAWERRRVLALRLSVWSVVILSLAFGTLSKRFFETEVGWAAALLILAVLLYLPIGFIWLVAMRRFRRRSGGFRLWINRCSRFDNVKGPAHMTIIGDVLAGRDKSLDYVKGNAIRDVWSRQARTAGDLLEVELLDRQYWWRNPRGTCGGDCRGPGFTGTIVSGLRADTTLPDMDYRRVVAVGR